MSSPLTGQGYGIGLSRIRSATGTTLSSHMHISIQQTETTRGSSEFAKRSGGLLAQEGEITGHDQLQWQGKIPGSGGKLESTHST